MGGDVGGVGQRWAAAGHCRPASRSPPKALGRVAVRKECLRERRVPPEEEHSLTE